MLCEEGDEAADRKLYPCKTLNMNSNSNQVCYSQSRLGYYIPRECSKAQMCLQKILHIISSVPRQESCADSQIGKLDLDANVSGGGRFCTDFNLRFAASTAEEHLESVAFVENGGDGGGGNGSETEKYSDGDGENTKCSDSTVTETDKCVVVVIEEHAEEIPEDSKIAEFHIQRRDNAESNRFDENESEKTVIEEEEGKNHKSTGCSADRIDDGETETVPFEEAKCKSGGDCLGLLIEAARLIFGDIGENEFETESTHKENESNTKDPSQLERVISESHSSESKRKLEGNWMVMNLVRDIDDDRSPLVRSKRGRSQVLPCRYKDSVLEAWRSPPLPSKVKVSKKQRRSRC